ncbi:MAG TPA: TetR/AcrR family transcriptional regulator [Thermoleophilia bacterium]|nr:TetR/AcrR family transcriptional regulator [Thermoleophilia bacterium]
MAPRPTVDKAARRAGLASVAAQVFAERGVANTSVSDIVRAVGIAQGTFYLYFASKEEIVLAVAEQMVEALMADIESAIERTGVDPVAKLLRLRDILSGIDAHPSSVELAEFIHRPENRLLHYRLTENLVPRLLQTVESIVVQGVEEGVFDVPDPRAAAWFILGGLNSAELAGTPATEMPEAIGAATELALRVLGYEENR